MHLLESIITCPKPLMFLIDNVVDSMVYLFNLLIFIFNT